MACRRFCNWWAVSPEGFAAPAVNIKDTPRFPWRGLMIDSGRHFIPLEVLRRNIDGMEAVKMNVFHWHLSENQGFRVESKKFPKLHENGLGRPCFYTQEEIRGLIAYARERGIRVVPEFDMPGHSTAWFVGHPELASGPGPYEIERKWGVFDPAMDPTNEKVYKFLDEFIGEMAKLFPDHFFHVGGDEVNGKEWDANPKIQEFIRAHGLKGNAGLQLYFNKKLQAIVSKHGKSMVGWDEVLDPTLPKDIVIQSWRGQASLAEAAKQGYRGILSNGYYLDLGWSAARHYAVDPMGEAAVNLSAEEKARILGGESCMWSEYVNAENIDSRIWPRKRGDCGALVVSAGSARSGFHVCAHAGGGRGAGMAGADARELLRQHAASHRGRGQLRGICSAENFCRRGGAGEGLQTRGDRYGTGADQQDADDSRGGRDFAGEPRGARVQRNGG